MNLRYLLKVILCAVECYFLWVTFKVVFNIPQTNYVVFNGSYNSVSPHLHGIIEIADARIRLDENAGQFPSQTDKIVNAAIKVLSDKKNDRDKDDSTTVRKHQSLFHYTRREIDDEEIYEDDLFEFGNQKLLTNFVKQSLDTITNIMTPFAQNDSILERGLKARVVVIDAVSSHGKWLSQRGGKGRSAYKILITKIEKAMAEEKKENNPNPK